MFCWSLNNSLYFSVRIVFPFVLTLIGGGDKIPDTVSEELRDDVETAVKSCENSAVFSSLPSAIKWLRDSVRHNQSVRFQVIGTSFIFIFNFHRTNLDEVAGHAVR